MPYDLTAHWKALEKALADYDESHKIPHENEEDKLAYEKQREMLNEMLRIGLEIEKTYWPSTKINLAKELEKLGRDKFGEDEIPSIKGNKSLHFSQFIFSPHLKRSQTVEYHHLIVTLLEKVGYKVEDIKNRAGNLAEKLDARIKEYIAQNSKICKQTMFATTQEIVFGSNHDTNITLGKRIDFS